MSFAWILEFNWPTPSFCITYETLKAFSVKYGFHCHFPVLVVLKNYSLWLRTFWPWCTFLGFSNTKHNVFLSSDNIPFVNAPPETFLTGSSIWANWERGKEYPKFGEFGGHPGTGRKESGESHSHSSSWWTSDTCTLVCQLVCTKFQAHHSKCCPVGISKTVEMKLEKKEKGKRRNQRCKVIPALCKQNDPVGSISVTLPSMKEQQKKTYCNNMHLYIRNCDEYWPNWTLLRWQTYLWSFLPLVLINLPFSLQVRTGHKL